MPDTRNTQQISQELDSRESDEPRALGYLQRLNLAGYDVKGQISSAYGQSGFGLSLGVNFDFGVLLVPFVHLDVGASLEGERTAHSLLLLQRMPHKLWLADMERPPQPQISDPDGPLREVPPVFWETQKPLALAYLQGKTWKLNVKGVVDAWAGLGSLGEYESTGVSVGVALTAEGGGVVTRLVDMAPRHYPPTPSDSSLNDDVDDLFEASLKNKAAAWLMEAGGQVKALIESGVPWVPLGERAEKESKAYSRWEKVKTFILKALETYDKLEVPDVDSAAIGDAVATVAEELVRAGKKFAVFAKGKKELKTQELMDSLGKIRDKLESWIKDLESKLVATHGLSLSADLVETRKKSLVVANARLAEVKDFLEALSRRQQRKIQRLSAPAQPAPKETAKPTFYLDILAVEGGVDVTASAKLVANSKATYHVEAGARAKARRISFRYQSFVPGHERRLICSQETAIRYLNCEAKSEATATGERERSAEKSNLVTMTYRSVIANWFDDVRPNNAKAIPNGSGISFGTSVIPKVFADYARFCRQMKRPQPGDTPVPIDLKSDPDLNPELPGLEKALTSQLRVTVAELREFMRNIPWWMGSATLPLKDDEKAEPFLIESAFALKDLLALHIEDRRPKEMFELAPFKSISGTFGRGNDLRLQSIRLRFRVHHDDDKSRSLIKLGWNPEPWGEDEITPWGVGSNSKDDPWYVRLTGIDPSLPDWLKMPSLALQLGIGVERVRRVGSEGIVELFQHLYPNPYSHRKPPKGFGSTQARALEARNSRAIADLLVPPVALFSQ